MRNVEGQVQIVNTLGVCLVCVALCVAPASAQSPSAGVASQLVIPFENITREPRLYWLAEASAVLLTDDLSALGARVFSRDDRLRAFEELRVPPVATLSDATVIRVGQVVGASQVIKGSYNVGGDVLTVRVRAIRLDTGRMSPEVVEGGLLTDMFAIFARVGRRLMPESAVSIDDMERGHPSLPAFEQFVKGVLAENPATQVAFLKEAVRLAPDFHRSRLSLWSVYSDQGEHQQAFDAVRGVAATDPLSRLARFLGSVSLIRLARNAEAVAVLTELQRDKADPALLNNLGVAQLRRPASAVTAETSPATYLIQAARLGPDDADILFNLGYAYWLARDTPNAVMWLREAVRRNPADDAAHYVLGVALQALGSTAEGQREKDLAKRLSSTFADWDARSSGPPIPPALERIKVALDAANSPRIEEALAAAGQRDQRELAAFHLDAGRRLVEAGRDAEAVGELRRTIYLSPYDREAHLLLGRVYLRTGRPREAIDELKISIWSDDQADAHLALAGAYLQVHEEAAARAEVQIVLTRDPQNADARRALDQLPPP